MPITAKVAIGEEVPIPTLWSWVTLRIEMPVEEETLKGSKAPVP